MILTATVDGGDLLVCVCVCEGRGWSGRCSLQEEPQRRPCVCEWVAKKENKLRNQTKLITQSNNNNNAVCSKTDMEFSIK